MRNPSVISEESSSPPRAEYPRPQLMRPAWRNLNGLWEFSFDDRGEGLREGWPEQPLSGEIVVPFPYQSRLSGIGDTSVHETVWYARDFDVPDAWRAGDLMLHLGAVDYRSTVWINGHEVGHNRGGHVPFSFNIAPYLRDGRNRLVVQVEDRQDPYQPRGKQSVSGRPRGIDYHCSTGIWQTVWLEPVPKARIEELVITPRLEHEAFELVIRLHGPASGWRVEAEVLLDGDVVARAACDTPLAGARIWLPMRGPRLWSPDAPHLYDLHVRLLQGSTVVDEVASYAGMRSVRLQRRAIHPEREADLSRYGAGSGLLARRADIRSLR